jgi:hypothetical protein
MIQQSDYPPIRKPLFLLFIVMSILFGGSSGCTLAPSLTPADIAPSAEAPKPADTLTPPIIETPVPPPTVPVTPTPRLEAEASPAPKEKTSDIRLGIGVYDADNVAFFNSYARDQDVIAARPPFMDLLDKVEIGQKMLIFAPRDEPLTNVEAVIAEAKARGFTILGYNLEQALLIEELVNKETEMQRLASKDDLLYAFGPTLLKLERHYDDLANYADIIVLQSQRYQTTEEYEKRVEELIGRIKAANPEAKVWVQVSVNPPEKRHVTPDKVISDIQLIADKADLVWIYYGPRTAALMEEVFKRLRQ